MDWCQSQFDQGVRTLPPLHAAVNYMVFHKVLEVGSISLPYRHILPFPYMNLFNLSHPFSCHLARRSGGLSTLMSVVQHHAAAVEGSWLGALFFLAQNDLFVVQDQ